MRTRPYLSVAALVAVLAGALLSGCGGGSTGTGSGDDTGAQPGFSSTEGPAVSDSPSPLDPSDGSGKQQPAITITGTPTEGVENGCIVMQSGSTLYLLLGGERSALMSGRPVAVRGTPAPGLMTTCQQGTPFQVIDVQPA
jgi:hypothetical protein